MEPALTRRQALRLPLGRWRALQIRLEEDRQCILEVMGATKDGRKELVAIDDGYTARVPRAGRRTFWE